MTAMTGARGARDWDSLQFRTISAICLPASFCAAVSRRLRADVRHGNASRRAIFAEAREGAGNIARFALAG